jgi:hypothetical protein
MCIESIYMFGPGYLESWLDCNYTHAYNDILENHTDSIYYWDLLLGRIQRTIRNNDKIIEQDQNNTCKINNSCIMQSTNAMDAYRFNQMNELIVQDIKQHMKRIIESYIVRYSK